MIEIANLANSYDLELLVLAAAYKARQEHKNDLRFLLVQSIQNPQNFFDIRNSYLKFLNGDKVTKMSNDVALGLILNANISKDSYQQIRDVSRKKNADIFPTYNEVRYSKKKCYPERIRVEESEVEVNLEDLLHHTTSRILEIKTVEDELKLKLQNLNASNEIIPGILHCKWGFDGATGQSEYKQRYFESTDRPIVEKSLFSTTLVPLSN